MEILTFLLSCPDNEFRSLPFQLCVLSEFPELPGDPGDVLRRRPALLGVPDQGQVLLQLAHEPPLVLSQNIRSGQGVIRPLYSITMSQIMNVLYCSSTLH